MGRELGDDPVWKGRLFESPIDTWVTALTLDGAAITVRRRVPPDLRLAATSEMRRRLSVAFAAESIGTGRWDTPPAPDPTVATATKSPSLDDVPDEESNPPP